MTEQKQKKENMMSTDNPVNQVPFTMHSTKEIKKVCVCVPGELWWDALDAVVTQSQVTEHRQVGQLHWD